MPGLHARTVHLIHLLQTKAFGLRNTQVDITVAEHQHAEENEQNEGTDIVGNPWGEETEEEIPEPVGRASERNGFG